MNLQRAEKQLYQFYEEIYTTTRKESINITYSYPYPVSSRHILAMGIAYHLSYSTSSTLHERTLEYLAMGYLY
jgi:hypothetical protein